MPDHQIHNHGDQLVLGCPYGTFAWVHKLLDSAAKKYGPRHRQFYHDMNTVNLIWYLYGYLPAFVAYQHIVLNFYFTELKEKIRELRRNT